MKDIVVIGAGLTGLTVAFLLRRQGRNVVILEKEDNVGGTIQTFNEDGYIYEKGPNTGVISNADIAELFEMLGLAPAIANEEAEKRLILKNNKWYPLPHGALSFLKTPLFTATDKIKIFFEPFRRKGNNPDESVAQLAARRIGQSFVDYAVNPFISGIYAGDPEKLVTRYALPKLYALEQNYGSFIGGSIKKSREAKPEREKKATRKVFSVEGGLNKLVKALKDQIGEENIICNASDVIVGKKEKGFTIEYKINNSPKIVESQIVISTIGSYALPRLLPFISRVNMDNLTNLNYAKIIQVAVALKPNALDDKFRSFGGLIPAKENKKLLGVLFPSYCFNNRSPQGCSLLAIYMGGIKHPELLELTDMEINELVQIELTGLFGINSDDIRFTRIFRHQYAIPQYEKSSGSRLETIQKLEHENTGLIIAGNIRDGIGMADRVKQAFTIAAQLKNQDRPSGCPDT